MTSLYQALAYELQRNMPVSENGQVSDIPVIHAIARKLLSEAFKGKPTAFKLVLELAADIQNKAPMAIPDDETLEKFSLEEATEAYKRLMRSGVG